MLKSTRHVSAEVEELSFEGFLYASIQNSHSESTGDRLDYWILHDVAAKATSATKQLHWIAAEKCSNVLHHSEATGSYSLKRLFLLLLSHKNSK